MPEEIKELDMDKYLVLKDEDIRKLHEDRQDELFAICLTITNIRKKEGKLPNQYLVLNLNDEINITYLVESVAHYDVFAKHNTIKKVKDIAVALVNAILKAKEK